MSNKFKNLLIIFIILLSSFPLIVSIMLAEFLPIDEWVVLIVISAVIFISGFSVGICIDYHTAVYECRNCGHEFKPGFNSYLWSMHTGPKRYLKCPECEERSWCREKWKISEKCKK